MRYIAGGFFGTTSGVYTHSVRIADLTNLIFAAATRNYVETNVSQDDIAWALHVLGEPLLSNVI